MIFSTDLIEDPKNKIEVELESEDDSNTFLESTLEYITEKNLISKGKQIAKSKMELGRQMAIKNLNVDPYETFTNPNKIAAEMLSRFRNTISYASLYQPFVDKMKEINQNCYDKIVKAIKTDKANGFYTKLKQNESDIKGCDTVVLKDDFIESYSNIREDKNSASMKTDLVKIFTFINEAMKKAEYVNSPNELETYNKMLKEHLDNTDSEFDQIRGRLTNQYAVIDENFAKALYRYFRSNQSEPTPAYIPPEGKGNVPYSFVASAYEGYMDIQKDLKYAIDIYSKRQYRDLEYVIRTCSYTRIKYSESFFNVETLKRITKIFGEPKKILDLYLVFYAAKMDALYERFKQNRAVMKAALEAIKEDK